MWSWRLRGTNEQVEDMSDLEKELKDLKAQLAEATNQLASVTRERDKMNGKVAKLETQVGSHKTLAESASSERDTLKMQLVTVSGERDQFRTELDTTKTTLEAIEPALERHKESLAGLHRSTLLVGIVDEDVLAIAPKVELDANGNPTESSVAKVREWRGAKSHFFTPAASTTPPPAAEPAQPAGQGPAGTPKPSTPVVDPAGNQLSWEYWDKLRDDNPLAFGERQTEYLAWAKAQDG